MDGGVGGWLGVGGNEGEVEEDGGLGEGVVVTLTVAVAVTVTVAVVAWVWASEVESEVRACQRQVAARGMAQERGTGHGSA
jgi:hypothetical protein